MTLLLYVDDEPALLELAKIYLESSGDFSVDTCLSAREALGRFRTHHYDLVISDYQMPEMDGIEFLKTLRSSGDCIPFIISCRKAGTPEPSLPRWRTRSGTL